MKRVFWMALGMIGLVLGAIGAGNDLENKNKDHVHRYAYHGIWIRDDGSCAGGQNHIGRGVGFPCAVFLF